MRDFRGLKVWEKAHALTLRIYALTRSFPKEELFGLTSQIRRSCASIPSNIAEACGRGTEAEFGRFLQIAMGSASETEYHLILAKDLGYLPPPEFKKCADEIVELKKMMSTLLKKINCTSVKSSRGAL